MVSALKRYFGRLRAYKNNITGPFIIGENPILQWWSENGFRRDIADAICKNPPSLAYPITDEETLRALLGFDVYYTHRPDPNWLIKKGEIRAPVKLLLKLNIISIIVLLIVLIPMIIFLITDQTGQIINQLYILTILFPYFFICIIPIWYMGMLGRVKYGFMKPSKINPLIYGSGIGFILGFLTSYILRSFKFPDLFELVHISFIGFILSILPSWLFGMVLLLNVITTYYNKLLEAIHEIRRNP